MHYLLKAFLFVCLHYSALGLIAALGYLFGRRLTRRFVYHSYLEQASFSIALGLGLLAYLVLLLGLVGLLYRWLVVAVLVAGVASCYPVRADWPRRAAGQFSRLKKATRSEIWTAVCLGLGIALLLAPFCLMPLYPPVADDAIMYHLPYAKIYIQHHGLVFTPHLRFAVAPQTNEMLFLLALLVYDDILAHLIEFLMLLTMAAAAAAFGWRFFSARAGCWAAAVLLSNPILLWLGSHAYVDMGMAFFCTMAVYAFWVWREEREQRWLVLAGIFSGLAVGTKLSSLIIPALIGAILFYLCVRERRPWPVICFGAVAFLVAFPWLARSFHQTGNPLFPFLHDMAGRLTGGWRWKTIADPHLWGDLSRPSNYWDTKGIESLLALPWNLTFHRRKYGSLVPISPILFFTLPLMIAAGILKRRIRELLGLAVAYTLYWFYTIQDLRYFAPALCMFSLTTAAALDYFSGKLSSLWKRAGSQLATAMGAIALISPGWLYAAYSFHNREALPVTAQQRDEFLTRNLPAYPAYQYLNRLKGSDYTVYSLFNHKMTYYADGRFIAAMFAPGGYASVFDGDFRVGNLINGRALYQNLKGLDVDYFLVESDEVEVKLPQDDFFKTRFKLVYEQPKLRLYELLKPSLENL